MPQETEDGEEISGGARSSPKATISCYFGCPPQDKDDEESNSGSILEIKMLRNKHVINCIWEGCLSRGVYWGKDVSPIYPFTLYISGFPTIQ
jgi:hypothetical protein